MDNVELLKRPEYSGLFTVLKRIGTCTAVGSFVLGTFETLWHLSVPGSEILPYAGVAAGLSLQAVSEGLIRIATTQTEMQSES